MISRRLLCGRSYCLVIPLALLVGPAGGCRDADPASGVPSTQASRATTNPAPSESRAATAEAFADGPPTNPELRLPNILFISADTLRADHLGCYGYDKPTSPFIDSLAAEGVQFMNAFAQTSWTLPSHLSMMTSMYPHTHTVETDKRTLPGHVKTLPQLLKKAGYTTRAFVTHVFLGKSYGFSRGFDTLYDLNPRRAYPEIEPLPRSLRGSATQPQPSSRRAPASSYSKAGPFVDHLIPRLELLKNEPFFLFLHFFDPHYDYEPPEEFARMFDPTFSGVQLGKYGALNSHIKGKRGKPATIKPEALRKTMALYDAEIRYMDTHLKRLFDAMSRHGLLDNTIVVFTSDHGEEFCEHGSMEGHQWTLYDEVIHVPLIIRFPDGRFRGEQRRTIAQHIDIAPTLMALAGLDAPREFEGRNLMPLIEKGDDPNRGAEYTYSQLKRFNRKWAVRTAHHKLVFTEDTKKNFFGKPVRPGYELYDLTVDPGETNNIYDPRDAVSRHLRAVLSAWMANKKPMEHVSEPSLTDEDIQRLRDLGYLE